MLFPFFLRIGEADAALRAEFAIGSDCRTAVRALSGELLAAVFAKTVGFAIDGTAGADDSLFAFLVLPFSVRVGKLFDSRSKIDPRLFDYRDAFVFMISKDLTAVAEGKEAAADADKRNADKQKEEKRREPFPADRGEKVGKADEGADSTAGKTYAAKQFELLFGFFVLHTVPFRIFSRMFADPSPCAEIYERSVPAFIVS